MVKDGRGAVEGPLAFSLWGNAGGSRILEGRLFSGDRKKLAEGQGFEPWVGCPTLIFKTSAFDHSATPPRVSAFSMYAVSFSRV